MIVTANFKKDTKNSGVHTRRNRAFWVLISLHSAIFRNLSENGLRKSYCQDPVLKKIVKMLMASAYLAENKIASFSAELLSEPEIVKKIAQCKSEMQKVLRYLHKTWIQTFPSKIETYKTDRHVSKQPIVASGGIVSGLVKFNVIPKFVAGCSSVFEATEKNCGESHGTYKTGKTRFKTDPKKENVK